MRLLPRLLEQRPAEQFLVLGLLAVAAMIDPPSLSDLAAVEIDTMLTGLAAFELAEEARLIGVEIALAHGY